MAQSLCGKTFRKANCLKHKSTVRGKQNHQLTSRLYFSSAP
ncbi:hypothetical protein [Cyanobacterium stanieri]|nr:hypothetical protein [Cyanobacterium stanieri]